MNHRVRWFPRVGDLVAVPCCQAPPGVKRECDYGIIIGPTKAVEFRGSYFDVYCHGVLLSLHIQEIVPMWDKKGDWLQIGKLAI